MRLRESLLIEIPVISIFVFRRGIWHQMAQDRVIVDRFMMDNSNMGNVDGFRGEDLKHIELRGAPLKEPEAVIFKGRLLSPHAISHEKH